MLTKEQADKIKKQLLSQVDRLPNENKEQIKENILGLDEEELEEFLKQNDARAQKSKQTAEPNACLFCSIAENKIPCCKIAENKKSIAILEINPLTKGHSIIIPFEHKTIDKLPRLSMSLAQKTAKKIKIKLKPEDIKIETSSVQGHAVINVIPLYKDSPPKQTRASEKELEALSSLLKAKKRTSRTQVKIQKIKIEKILQELSFRIP